MGKRWGLAAESAGDDCCAAEGYCVAGYHYHAEEAAFDGHVVRLVGSSAIKFCYKVAIALQRV